MLFKSLTLLILLSFGTNRDDPAGKYGLLKVTCLARSGVIVIVAKTASILPFFKSGILVLAVVVTKSAFAFLPNICLVKALAKSISKPSILPVLTLVKPKSLVSALTPQTICLSALTFR